MHVHNTAQEVPATVYANTHMEHSGAVGAIFRAIQDGETPPNLHPTDEGTIELTYHFSK